MRLNSSGIVRPIGRRMLRTWACVAASALAGACTIQPILVPPSSGSRPIETTEVSRPRVAVSPSALEFGEMEAGRGAEAEVSLQNQGNTEVRVRRATADGPGFRVSRDGCSGRRLRPGDVCSVWVAFQPDREGRYSGALDLSVPELPEEGVSIPLSAVSRTHRRPNIRLSASSVDFGAVEAGRAKAAAIEVGNDGRGELRVEGLDLRGAGFDLTSDNCSGRVIPSGRSCSAEVRFSPDRAADYGGELSISSSDPDQRRVAVPLRGRGERRARPDIAVAPSRLDFGRVDAGRAQDLAVEVGNAGRAELWIKRAFADGPGFEIASDNCTDRTIPPGRSCSLTVRFSPSSAGDFSGNLSVVSNDRDQAREVVPLTGQGQQRGQPNLQLRVSRLDFGTVEAGSALVQEVEARNDGRADLRFQDCLLEGQAFGLAADGCSGRVLPPGRSCAVSVRFSPDRGGAHFGNLIFSSNDPDQRRATVPLKGVGEKKGRPEVTLKPSRIDFGRTEVGKPKAQDLEVRNDGHADLKVKRVRVEGPGFEVESDSCSDRAIPPGRSCAVTVRFSPAREGEYNGTLGVPSNDPDEKKSFAALRGLAEERRRPPERSCQARPVDFGDGRDRMKAVVEGDLGDAPCVTLGLRPEETRRLLVCAPEGYAPRGGGLEATEDGCEKGKGRYQAYRSPKLKKDSDVSLTFVRGANAAARYRFVLEWEGKDDSRPPPPPGVPPFLRRGPGGRGD